MAAPFLRSTNPWVMPVALTATKFEVPDNYFTTGPGTGLSSFWIMNPNLFWVRIIGSGNYDTGTYVPVTDYDGANPGWLYPPGFFGAFATLFPRYISTLAVAEQGVAPTIVSRSRVELSYGGGA